MASSLQAEGRIMSGFSVRYLTLGSMVGVGVMKKFKLPEAAISYALFIGSGPVI